MTDDASPPVPSVPVPIDWALLGRYGVLVGLCDLVPVPFVDRWIANALRRRLVRKIAGRHGCELPPESLARLADAQGGGCVGCLVAVLAWPVKKVLKTLTIVFQVKGIADTSSEVMHRGLLLEEAFEAGWMPGDADAVRAAMDRALASVDTRPVERALNGSLKDVRSDLNLAIWETVRIARGRIAGRASDAVADAADAADLGPASGELSRAMAAALRTAGLVPELIAWFRAEMTGEPPKLEVRVGGPIVPELVDGEPPAAPEPAAGLPAPIEDAVEVAPPRRGD